MFDGAGQKVWRTAVTAAARAACISDDGQILVFTTDDGTIHWKNLDTGADLLSVFFIDEARTWVAWTPSGFFAGSELGESLLGFRGLARDGSMTFVPMIDFADLLRRPDVVGRALDR